MSWLVDGNALIGLALLSHPHHLRCKRWFETLTEPFYTCSVTEGTFLRLHMMLATDQSASKAWSTLRLIQADSMHVFINEGLSYGGVSPRLIQGHKQVTDAWLAEVARFHSLRLATLDQGLAITHSDVATLIP